VHAQSVRLFFVGDVMLDDGPGRVVAEGRDPFAAFDRALRDADVVVGNLECPVGAGGAPIDGKPFTFRADPRVAGVLARRFTAVALANNHTGDYGEATFLETLALLDAAGIGRFGGGRNLREAHAPFWISPVHDPPDPYEPPQQAQAALQFA
jgi:poly-gamma-glutamate synthesis protein (capsule biosynthesis protein)